MRAAFVALLLATGCTAGPDWNAAAEQALADGRASLAVLGGAASARPAPREPARIRPLRTDTLPPTAEAGTPAGTPAGPAPQTTQALTGSAPERLVEMLGEPALRREEGPVSIWLYNAAACQLDVMFYPTAEGLRVAYVQARAGGFAQRTEGACLRDLAAQARRRSLPEPGPRQGRLDMQEPVG